MNDLRDSIVLVLGLGDSGLGMARWCARWGAQVRVWDSRDTAPQDAALADHLPAVQRLRGPLTPEMLAGVSRVLKSPGLSPLDERIAPLLKQAHEAGLPVQGELELFIAALAALQAERAYAPQLIAITGTNGKTTTTAMTALLVARTGRRVAMAGNIGPTLLQTLADALDAQLLDAERFIAASLGARTLELPARRRAWLRAACGDGAQHHRRPPRLARRHAGLHRSEGEHLRRPHDDGAEP